MEPTTVSGKLMFLWYSDTEASDDSQLVCMIESNYSGTRNEITDETNCGSLSDTGAAKHQLTGTLVIDTAPDSGEVSYAALQTLFVNDTTKYWMLRDEDNTIFHGGLGKISQLGQQNSASGGFAKATVTISLSGALDTTSQS